MAQAPQQTVAPAAPAVWRWTVLVVISVAMFGNYYAYDAIAPVADLLQKSLGFSDTQIGTLNAIYSLPNIIMVLIGGVIVDRFGARVTTLAFASICLIGAAVTAASSLFPVMAAGRLIFGLGAESMIVAISVAIGQWFVGRQLGFAFGLNLSIARAGSYSADMSPTWFTPLYDAGWQPPLWLAAGFMGMGVLAAFVYYLLERSAARRYELAKAQPSDRFVWGDVWRFDRSYWYIVGLCVAFYSVIFPFRSTFAILYFQHAHGLSLPEAGAMNGWVFFAAIFATPLFGLVADRFARRSALMTVGALLLAAVFPILLFTNLSLWISTVLIGIAFSLVPAVLWPALPYLVTPDRLGTAFGLAFMLQNVGMLFVNIGAGALNDAAGASESNPAGYEPMLWLFFTLSIIALVFAIALRRRETGSGGHGLETLIAGQSATAR
jgi:MFS family permease